jgi:branched-chain amino acid transport system ATP-binding protein
VRPDTNTAILETRGIEMRFNSLVVLNGIDFKLGADEAVGIIGPNGAGKTTFLSTLVGAHMPTAGTIRFRHNDITFLPAPERSRIGLIRTHQIPRPFTGMTILENALVAATHGGGLRGDAAYERALEALEFCGMTGLANRRAETLGLLDRKRLELVRSLATNPAVLLLDEIGGGLTDREAGELVDMIKALRSRAIAIVWIEHIVHVLLQVVERLICLDAGRIIADGTPDTVMKDPDVVRAYLGGAVQ